MTPVWRQKVASKKDTLAGADLAEAMDGLGGLNLLHQAAGAGELLRPFAVTAEANVRAAQLMLRASANMMAAATGLTGGAIGGISPALVAVKSKEVTAAAVELGIIKAARKQRESGLLSLTGSLPSYSQAGLPGASYGRAGASLTGEGEKAQSYGAIGGMLGYAIGGPIGGFVGGLLGGLFGGKSNKRAEEEARKWLNPPEAFEIEAYLYNLTRAYWHTRPSFPFQRRGLPASGWFSSANWPLPQWRGSGGSSFAGQTMLREGAVQINIYGQDEAAGLRAGRAAAGELGRLLELNSLVVPAAYRSEF
jgi:hypothetical protein